MRGYVMDAGGTQWTLPNLLSWRMEYTAGVPCDSFWLRCTWDGDNTTRPGDWVTFSAWHDGKQVFCGVVDECEVTLTAAGRQLEVSGRGLAARLLDNEALGQDYMSATQADIIKDHVAPYGIVVAPGANLPPVSRFSVATGSSEWSVVYNFARYYGGVAPRFDQRGRLVLTGWEDSQMRVIDNSTAVTALICRDRRYGVLSQVLVRDRWSGQMEEVNHDPFQKIGGRARRIITMPERSSYQTMRYTGRFQLEKSTSELHRIEITVAEAFCAWPGDLVQVNRSGWDWNGKYRAVQVSVGMDEKGYWSRLELADPNFTV